MLPELPPGFRWKIKQVGNWCGIPSYVVKIKRGRRTVARGEDFINVWGHTEAAERAARKAKKVFDLKVELDKAEAGM